MNELVDVKKVRRTTWTADAGGSSLWKATCARTGDILMCAQLEPLLKHVAESLVKAPDAGWQIVRELGRA